VSFWWYMSQTTAGGILLALVLTLAGWALFLWASAGRRRAGPWRALAPTARLGVFLAAAAGVLLFDPSITLVQVPLQKMVVGWVSAIAHAGPASQASMAPWAILVTGLVQEPIKLLAVAVGWLVARHASVDPVSRTVWFGSVAGAAYGGIEAASILSMALAQAAGAPATVLIVPVIERFFAVLFHLATPAIVVLAWSRGGTGRGLFALGCVAAVHSAINCNLLWASSIGTFWFELIVGVLELTVLAYLVAAIRGDRAAGRAPRLEEHGSPPA